MIIDRDVDFTWERRDDDNVIAITVELADYEEVTSDGGVIWNSNNPETIISGSNNGWYWDEDLGRHKRLLN